MTQYDAQCLLHHVTYSDTKFEVTTSNGLEGDTFTRHVTDARTDRRRTTDRLWYEINIPFFLKKKRVYNYVILYIVDGHYKRNDF